MKPNLISGVQPSGRLHLGNYLGALKNFVELQNSDQYNCYFFIADLHSLTEEFEAGDPTSPSGLRGAGKKQQIINLAADYLATGLQPKKSLIFVQSQVPAHSELTVILNNFTPFGELSRMTQFKEKSEQQKENINVGLFDYPVLMAADIFLYDTQLVPVGDDQLQHLELTRALARKFNNKFGQTFIEPQPFLTSTPRVMSLDDPAKKMSKSLPAGCLFIDDEPAMIEEKIKTAVTDSGKEIEFDPQSKPGISNLLQIMSGLSGKPIPELETAFRGKSYVRFKKALARITAKHFAAYRRKKAKLLQKPEKIEKMLARGAKIANKIANEKIRVVKERLGLL